MVSYLAYYELYLQIQLFVTKRKCNPLFREQNKSRSRNWGKPAAFVIPADYNFSHKLQQLGKNNFLIDCLNSVSRWWRITRLGVTPVCCWESVTWPTNVLRSRVNTEAGVDTCHVLLTCTATVTTQDTRAPRAGRQTRGDRVNSSCSLLESGQQITLSNVTFHPFSF